MPYPPPLLPCPVFPLLPSSSDPLQSTLPSPSDPLPSINSNSSSKKKKKTVYVNSLIVSSASARLTFFSSAFRFPSCTTASVHRGKTLARSSLPPAALVSPAEGSCAPEPHGRMFTHSLRVWVSTLASNETFFFSFQWQCRVPDNSGHLKGKPWELGEQGLLHRELKPGISGKHENLAL